MVPSCKNPESKLSTVPHITATKPFSQFLKTHSSTSNVEITHPHARLNATPPESWDKERSLSNKDVPSPPQTTPNSKLHLFTREQYFPPQTG